MAGPVKGTWGGEDIELNDAATETTLLKLLEAMNKMSAGGGGGSGAADAVEKLANESKDATKNITDLGEAADSAASSLSRGFSVLTAATSDLLGEFLVGGNSIADFTAHITGAIAEIPLIGGIIAAPAQIFANVLNNNIASFRELSNVGVGFGTSLFDIQQAATRSGLSLATFQSTISNNAETLAKFGGNAADGAKRFQEVSGILQKDFGPQFSALGMTMEQTAQFTADYMELQTSLGRNQGRDARSQAQGTANYIAQLDQLSKVTGKQRDQVADMLQQQAQDSRMKSLLMSMDEDAAKSLQNITAIVGTKDPKIADAITELVATGGAPMSEFGRSIATMYPEVARASAALKEGAITEEQYMKVLESSVSSAQDRMKVEGKTIAMQQQMGISVNDATVAFSGLGSFTTDLTETQKKQQDQMQKGSKGLLDFERRLTEARNMIFGALINSGIFQTLEKSFSGLTDMLTNTESEGFKKFKDMLVKVSDVVKGFMDTFMEAFNDPNTTFSEALQKAWSSVEPTIGPAFEKLMDKLASVGGSIISSLFDALLPDLDTLIVGILGGIGAALLAPFVGIPALIATGIIGGLAAMFGYEAVKGFFSDAFDSLMAVPNAIMDVFSGEGSVRGVFDAALDAIFFIPNMILDVFDIGPVSELFESAVDRIFAVPKAIMDLFSGKGSIRGVFDAALDAFYFIPNMILDVFDIGPVSELFEGAIDSLFAVPKAIMDVFSGKGSIRGVFDAAWDAIMFVPNKIMDFFKSDTASRIFSKAWDSIMFVPNKIMEFFKSDTASQIFSTAWEAITFVPNTILGFFNLGTVEEIFGNAWNTITGIPQKILDFFGIDIEFPNLIDLFGGLFQSVMDWFSNIELPSISDLASGAWKMLTGGGDEEQQQPESAPKSRSEMNAYERAKARSDRREAELRKIGERSRAGTDAAPESGTDVGTNNDTAKQLGLTDFDAALEGAGSSFDSLLESSSDFDAALEGAGSSFDSLLESTSAFDAALEGLKGLDTSDLSSYNKEMISALAEIKNATIKTNSPASTENIGEKVKSLAENTQTLEQERLDKLNNTMERMLAAVAEGNNISGKSLKAFKNNTSSVW